MEPVTVVGAGLMGRGIAQVAALACGDVRLVDVDEGRLTDAMDAIERDLGAGVERGKVTPSDAERAMGSIRTSTDLTDACGGAFLVIEAVVERMDVKHDVLREVEAAVDEDAVIATNTSAMSVTEIVSVLDDPTRGVGMHFFNPVPRMRLCEIVVALQTGDSTIESAVRAAEAMGKSTVRVRDLPGFATSRINALIGNESMRMLEENVAAADDIDRAVKLGLNHPMGPLEMGDLVGWDTRLDILDYLAGTLGERFRPTVLHRQLVSAGRYGRKTRHGVYRYDAVGRRLDRDA